MIQIWARDMGGGTFCNGAKLLHTGLSAETWQSLEAFTQGLRNYIGHGFSSFPRYGRSQSVGFRIFYIERSHWSSVNQPELPPFYQRKVNSFD